MQTNPVGVAVIPPFKGNPRTTQQNPASLHGQLTGATTPRAYTGRPFESPPVQSTHSASVVKRLTAVHMVHRDTATSIPPATPNNMRAPPRSRVDSSGNGGYPKSAAEEAFLKKFGTGAAVFVADSSLTNAGVKSAKQTAIERQYEAFCTVYGSDTYAKCINLAMRTQDGYSFDTKDLTGNLAEREHRFKVTPEQRAALKEFCKNVSFERLKAIDDYIYIGVDPGRRRDVFSGQGITKAGLQKLRFMYMEHIPVKPPHFLSSDKNLAIAEKFAQRGGERSGISILFKINGYSNFPMDGMCNADEETVSLFSTHATFEITSMTANVQRTHYTVGLRETKPSVTSQPLPY